MNNGTAEYPLAPGFADRDRLASLDDADEIMIFPQLEKYFEIVRHNLLLCGGALALIVSIGLVFSLLATPQYRATTRIEISPAEQNVTNVEGLQSEAVMMDPAYLPTQYELLESYSLAQRVVRHLDLANSEEFLTSFEGEIDPTQDFESEIIEVLFDHIVIEPLVDSLLVDISFESPSRRLSVEVADAWAEAFVEEDLGRKFGATLEAREFLEERLRQTRERLEDAERELIAYATDQDLLTIVGGSAGENDSSETAAQTLVATELAEFNQALLVASAERIAAEAAVASRGAANVAIGDDFGSETIARLRERRALLQTQLAQLLSRFQEGYPPVQAARAELEEINEAIAREERDSFARIQGDYREALAREERLRSRVNDLRQQFISQRQDSVQYNILQREVDTNRELYAGLLQRYREIGVVGVGESNVLVVDTAQMPQEPFSPNLPFNLAISFLVGLVLVGVGVVVYDALDQSLRDPKQVKSRLGLMLLGNIPLTDEDEIVDDLQTSYSELYESYFSATASLGFGNGGSIPKTIMFTSSRPGEGKSLSALAIAYLLGRQNKRVLLLDCDLRKSGVGKYLAKTNTTGVSQYLQGNDDWRAMLTDPEPFEGIQVIFAGRKPLSVAELMTNGRMPSLLDQLEQEYDHIVIDGPPVLGLVDAPLMASWVDGVVFVVEANAGKWRFLEKAVQRLREGNAEIIGGLVTKLDDRNVSYGYGEGYGYGYGYGVAAGETREEAAGARA